MAVGESLILLSNSAEPLSVVNTVVVGDEVLRLMVIPEVLKSFKFVVFLHDILFALDGLVKSQVLISIASVLDALLKSLLSEHLELKEDTVSEVAGNSVKSKIFLELILPIWLPIIGVPIDKRVQ